MKSIIKFLRADAAGDSGTGRPAGRRSLGNLVKGTFANGFTVVCYAVLQLATVPVLTHAWGVEGFGIWLMLITIPGYVALSDLGFLTAATSEIVMHTARGDAAAANGTYQSAVCVVTAMSGIVMLGGAVLALLQITGLTAHWSIAPDILTALVILVFYSSIALFSQLLLCAYQGGGKYASGTAAYHFLVLVEGLTSLVVAYFGGHLAGCAATLLVFRLISTTGLFITARRDIPGLRLGVSEASWTEVRRLGPPAAAAFAIPMALALNLQGLVMVVGFTLGAAAVATWAAVRTASRVAIQVVGALNRASMPELSAVTARGDKDGIRRLVQWNLLALTTCLVPAGIALGVFGNALISVWTHGQVVPPPYFTLLIGLAMVLHGVWFYLSNLLIASSSHVSVTPAILIINVGVVAASLLVAPHFGLYGIATTLAVGEACCTFCVLRAARQKGLLGTIPRPADALRLLRSLANPRA